MGSWNKTGGSKFDKYLDGRKHRIKRDKFPNHKDLESIRTSILVIAKKRGIAIATQLDREKNEVIVMPRNEGK